MTMTKQKAVNRREFIVTTAIIPVVGAAGCLGDDDDDTDETPSGTEDDDDDTTETSNGTDEEEDTTNNEQDQPTTENDQINLLQREHLPGDDWEGPVEDRLVGLADPEDENDEFSIFAWVGDDIQEDTEVIAGSEIHRGVDVDEEGWEQFDSETPEELVESIHQSFLDSPNASHIESDEVNIGNTGFATYVEGEDEYLANVIFTDGNDIAYAQISIREESPEVVPFDISLEKIRDLSFSMYSG